MQQPMIAGVSPETTHDLSDSRAKRPFATVALDGQLFAMMQNGELDSGIAYELARTADLAAEAGDHGDAETLGHLQATLMYQVEQQVLGPMVEPTVAALLFDVQNGKSMATAVEERLGQQDVAFLPEVAVLLEEASPAERPQLRAIVNELERRSAARFAAVKQQLRAVLQAGSVDAMGAAMARLVRRDEA